MSELLQQVRDGRASEVLIRDADIVLELKAEGDRKPQRIVATRLPGIDETAIVKELQDKGVKFAGFIERTSWLQTFFFAWLLPIAVLGAIWFLLMRRLQGGRGGPLSIGRNKARIYDATKAAKVTFEDVAGVDEAEA
jgi:cell division protease FtsH